MELTGQIVKHGDDGNSRAIVPLDAEVLGQELLAVAAERRISVKKNSLYACAEDFERQKEVLRQRIAEATARIEQIEARQADIAVGKFAVTEDARIIFPHLPAPHIG